MQSIGPGGWRWSGSDPESRLLVTSNKGSEVAYNVQVTTDAQHCLPIDYKMTNSNDNKAMGNMLRRAKSILRTNEFTALYDKGYHTGSEFEIATQLGIETIVAIPDISPSSQSPDPTYNANNFHYSIENDCYICPQGEELRSNGKWYQKSYSRFQQYRTKACQSCPVKSLCTASVKGGKVIQRNEYAQYIEKNRNNVSRKQNLYKNRKAIVEHPFGTIKRQWGFDYILTKKGMQRAGADVGLMFTAYNLRRIINIIGQKNFKEYLKKVFSAVFSSYKSLWCQVLEFLRIQQEYHGYFSGSKNIILKPAFTGYYLEKPGIVRGF